MSSCGDIPFSLIGRSSLIIKVANPETILQNLEDGDLMK